jgi:uncharacterized membrane protein YgcG
MDLTPFGPREDRHDKGAQEFAQFLHNDWGVGIDTPCGGTGILIFLSDKDRTIYISRGKALESVLTDRRLDQTIRHMKPLLQQRLYGDAITNAIREIDYFIRLGEPQLKERINDWVTAYLGLVWFAALVGFAFRAIRKESERRRIYAQVTSHLDDLDRARAEALQGRFLAVSCPICLESFKSEEDTARPKTGSDGLPLKLLRCGHVFDETCWSEWVNSGQGNVCKCPICKQDVGGEREVSLHSDSTLTRRAVDSQNDGDNDSQHDGSSQEETRILRQYNRERNFRLVRLGNRYPQFIRQQQIQRWTQSTYDGSLARDPSFVNSDPHRHATTGGGSKSGTRSSSSGSSGFGGGSSGGGRGGRW